MRKNKILKFIITYFIFIAFFVLLLILMSSFSSELIYDNVKKSSEILLSEGNRKKIYIPYRETYMQFDNYTDALMINTAYSIDSSEAINSAFFARKNYIPGVTKEIYEDTAGELKSSSKYKYHDEVGELNDLVNGEKAESFEYARYWHGYLIFLRPLLLLFNLQQIRVILTILLLILAIILLYLIYRKLNILVASIFFTGLLGAEYFYLGFSLQGIFVFLIMMISSTILILGYNKIKNKELYFFIIGMITNFFDFLTVPIVTLFIPLILDFLLQKRNEKYITIKMIFINIMKFSIIWGIGYGLTWFTKWLLIDCFFGKNMIITALNQVIYRSASTEQFNIFHVINENMYYLYVSLFISLVFTFCLMYINIKKYKIKNIHINNGKKIIVILPYIIISIVPFIWYMLLQNHSYYHAFFTYRNLMITNICFNLCLEEFLKSEEYNEK